MKHLKYIVLAVVAAVALMALAVPAQAADTGIGTVISETLTIRETASTGAAAVGTAVNGETLDILGVSGRFYHVRAQSVAPIEGYVLASFIVRGAETATALANNTLIYAMPDAGSKTVGEVDEGTVLTVIGEMSGFWAVNLRTASGFVRMQDVAYSGPQPTARPTRQPTATPAPTQPSVAGYYTVRDTALRSQPSFNAPADGIMLAGSYVYIGTITNGFGQNVENGKWLLMTDLSRSNPGVVPPLETSTPGAARYLVITNGASVYAGPSTTSDVVGTLNDGDTVILQQTEGSMGLVSYGRQRGWMRMSDILPFGR